jgi:diaminobutyrate-2-oxoglutarate transaminase
MHDVFDRYESQVRSYCRSWPTVFDQARGSRLIDESGAEFVDFFSGAGALNYGHNHPLLKQALIDYLSGDGVIHSLDMFTVAKRDFLQRFAEVVLEPRSLPYVTQFPGPTGTNSVEAALKLARKVTGREHVVSFTNAFHGMTLGSLAVTGNSMKRSGAGVPLTHTTAMPYCNYLDEGSSLSYLELVIEDSGSGFDLPAAVIVETVQGEGGLRVASPSWLRELAALCQRNEILLIVDDVQMGCGRTGPFFSFEEAGITPDIVCLSKSLSGSGLPMAVTLFRPEHDVWGPGEHNGTFRGNNPAFVTATASLAFWEDDTLENEVKEKAEFVERVLFALAGSHDEVGAETRGRGLAQGITFADPEVADRVCKLAFENGLLVETSGPDGEVVKLMPPLNIDVRDLELGLEILASAVDHVATSSTTVSQSTSA